jgi:anti-sigma B factor antagonist
MDESHSSQPTINVRTPQPGAALIVLAGEHDLYSAARLQQTFADLLLGSEHLIVDLSTTEFIDSTIIGVIIQAKKQAEGLNRKFTLVLGSAPAVERILDATGVLLLFSVAPSVELALAA